MISRKTIKDAKKNNSIEYSLLPLPEVLEGNPMQLQTKNVLSEVHLLKWFPMNKGKF